MKRRINQWNCQIFLTATVFQPNKYTCLHCHFMPKNTLQNDTSEPKLNQWLKRQNKINYQQIIKAITKLNTPKLRLAHHCTNNQHGKSQRFIISERHELWNQTNGYQFSSEWHRRPSNNLSEISYTGQGDNMKSNQWCKTSKLISQTQETHYSWNNCNWAHDWYKFGYFSNWT